MASGGAGGKEVGRLSIRVVPDMDGFREKVEAGANAAGKDVTVPVNADTSKARRKIDELRDEKGRIDLEVDADTAKANAKIAEAARPRQVKLKADYDEGALDRVKKNIDRFLTNESIEVGKAHQRLLATMRDHAPKQQVFDLKLNPEFDYQLRNRVRRAAESAAKDAERALSRIGGGNNRRGGGLFGSGLSLLGGLGGLGGGGGKGLDVLPNFFGLGGIPSVALIVGALSLVAPALALLSQALIGLPALITSVALPIGVFALGMGGIKKALEASGFLDVILGKTKKDGTKGKDKSEPGELIKDMQKRVSDVFEQGFTPMFQKIAGVLPQLTAGLPFVAKGIVDLAGGLSRALVNPQNIALFDRFTNSVSTMLTNLSPGLENFSTGMFKLITNVGDHLPGLGNTMSEWANEFTNWVDKISKPKQWWGKDIPNSSDLDQAVQNMKPVLNSVKDFVGDLLSRGVTLAKDPNLASGIKNFMDGLEHLAEQISRMGPVFESLAKILDKIPKPPPEIPVQPGSDRVTPDYRGPGYQPGKPPITKDEAEEARARDRGVLGNMWDHPTMLIPFYEFWKQWLPKIGDAASSAYDWTKENLGPGLSGVANAAPEPFNPGKPLAPGAPPVPVQIVQGPQQSNLAPLFPGLGIPGSPAVPPPAPVPPVAPGGSQAPVQAPKIEAPKAPEGSDKIWEPLVQATQKAGADINTEVGSWAGKIKSALDSASAGANASGQAIGSQLAAGIRAGEGQAVDAAHHLADAVKGALPHSPAKHGPFAGQGWTQVKTSGGAIASQFADGLDGGYDGVVAASQRLAQAVHDSMTQNGGVLPPQVSAAVKRESAAISIELDKLKKQRDALDPKDKEGRKAIKAQMDQLNSLRTELGLSSKESDYAKKYGGAGGDGPFTAQGVGQMISQQIASGLNAALGFGKANVSQLETDLGMSGNGVVEKLGDYGINFLTSGLNSLTQGFFGGTGSGTTINVGNMDDALKAKQTLDNRQSMQHTQRSN